MSAANKSTEKDPFTILYKKLITIIQVQEEQSVLLKRICQHLDILDNFNFKKIDNSKDFAEFDSKIGNNKTYSSDLVSSFIVSIMSIN